MKLRVEYEKAKYNLELLKFYYDSMGAQEEEENLFEFCEEKRQQSEKEGRKKEKTSERSLFVFPDFSLLMRNQYVKRY